MDKAINILKDNLKDETVVVATSGGPDSMALLYLVSSLKEKLNLKIVCSHVNHKLRAESDQEEVMVKNFCDKNNLIFELLTIDSYNNDNFHNSARTKRYDFFDKCVKKYQAKHLLTAHHGDDLMETILMRIVRGSSLRGYAGFSLKFVKDDYTILRPLIDYTKDEILEFVLENNIPYAVDKSNEKDVYTRNRFRKYVLPPLKKEDNCVHKKFYKFSKTLELYDDYISKETLKFLMEVYKDNILNVMDFKKLDYIIQIRIIEKILEEYYQDSLNIITDKHTNLIYEMIVSDKLNLSINLPLGYVGVKNNDKFEITKEKKEADYCYEFNEFVTLPKGGSIKVSESTSNSNYVCRLYSKEVKYPLYIRNRRDGDRIFVKGLNGRKKVKDIFIDSKLSMKERSNWPILVDSDNNILWIPGLKKSKFDKQKDENYDIILEYFQRREP